MKNFLEPDIYNNIIKTNEGNCLGFALGEDKPHANVFGCDLSLSKEDADGRLLPINRCFTIKAREFGLSVKEVNSLEETKGKIAFLVYGWFDIFKTFVGISADFHVVRIEKDGSLVHKPDWKLPACVTSFEEIQKEYPEKPYIFIAEED